MSNDTFKNHPDLQEYFETSDGTKFYKEDLAKNHARTLKNKSVEQVFKDQDIQADRETAKEIAAKIPTMDLETAQEYLEGENLQDPRKTVVAGLEKRIAELQADVDPGNDHGGDGANQNTED